MKITTTLSDQAILTELGARLMRLRLERNLTQAEVANEAGVAKRTVERIEAGGGAQLGNFVRICRVLDFVGALDRLVPEPAISPLAMLAQKNIARKRASQPRQPKVTNMVANTATQTTYQRPAAVPPPQARQWRWGEDSVNTTDGEPE